MQKAYVFNFNHSSNQKFFTFTPHYCFHQMIWKEVKIYFDSINFLRIQVSQSRLFAFSLPYWFFHSQLEFSFQYRVLRLEFQNFKYSVVPLDLITYVENFVKNQFRFAKFHQFGHFFQYLLDRFYFLFIFIFYLQLQSLS